MMNTCKWTSFAWCVSDGFKDDSDLSDDQKIRKIKTLPSFIDYFGYMFFFCGCIAGVYYNIYIYIYIYTHTQQKYIYYNFFILLYSVFLYVIY